MPLSLHSPYAATAVKLWLRAERACRAGRDKACLDHIPDRSSIVIGTDRTLEILAPLIGIACRPETNDDQRVRQALSYTSQQVTEVGRDSIEPR